MKLKLITAPSVEPLSVLDVEKHCRLDSDTFEDELEVTQSIVSGSHDVAAAYAEVGDGVDVLGYDVLVLLESGTNGTGGTVDAKLQDSDDDTTYADVTDGAFTQVTEANDNAVQEIQYNGGKQYVRAVATIAVAACGFGVSVVKGSPTIEDSAYILSLITAVRKHIEGGQTNRALITQTWELYLDEWPGENFLTIPLPPLQSITSVKYTDADDTEYTMDSDDYYTDTVSEPGRIVLKGSGSWPSTTLRSMNPIVVRFVAGYGDAASDVPEDIRHAIKMATGQLYGNREDIITGTIVKKLGWIDVLLADYRIWSM